MGISSQLAARNAVLGAVAVPVEKLEDEIINLSRKLMVKLGNRLNFDKNAHTDANSRELVKTFINYETDVKFDRKKLARLSDQKIFEEAVSTINAYLKIFASNVPFYKKLTGSTILAMQNHVQIGKVSAEEVAIPIAEAVISKVDAEALIIKNRADELIAKKKFGDAARLYIDELGGSRGLQSAVIVARRAGEDNDFTSAGLVYKQISDYYRKNKDSANALKFSRLAAEMARKSEAERKKRGQQEEISRGASARFEEVKRQMEEIRRDPSLYPRAFVQEAEKRFRLLDEYKDKKDSKPTKLASDSLALLEYLSRRETIKLKPIAIPVGPVVVEAPAPVVEEAPKLAPKVAASPTEAEIRVIRPTKTSEESEVTGRINAARSLIARMRDDGYEINYLGVREAMLSTAERASKDKALSKAMGLVGNVEGSLNKKLEAAQKEADASKKTLDEGIMRSGGDVKVAKAVIDGKREGYDLYQNKSYLSAKKKYDEAFTILTEAPPPLVAAAPRAVPAPVVEAAAVRAEEEIAPPPAPAEEVAPPVAAETKAEVALFMKIERATCKLMCNERGMEVPLAQSSLKGTFNEFNWMQIALDRDNYYVINPNEIERNQGKVYVGIIDKERTGVYALDYSVYPPKMLEVAGRTTKIADLAGDGSFNLLDVALADEKTRKALCSQTAGPEFKIPSRGENVLVIPFPTKK